MTTMTLGGLLLSAVIIFALINIILWGLEFIATIVKCLLDYFRGKRHTWKQNYVDVRLLFTNILLIFSFAELTPAQYIKHKNKTKVAYQQSYQKKIDRLQNKKDNMK